MSMSLATVQRHPRAVRAATWLLIGAPAVIGACVAVVLADVAWARWDRAHGRARRAS